MFGFRFFFNSILQGGGLAMDAFSVSLANGLHEPQMHYRRVFEIAGIFALFQFLMPLIGWSCVSTVAEHFKVFAKAVPWIALILLSFIGGKMLYEGIRCKECEECTSTLGISGLLLQGVATSIDALSVGFTIAEYSWIEAICACLLIGFVTFLICTAGVSLGRAGGTQLSGKAGILGGAILIFIGLEIFITSFL
ncbi:MAG: manganese efflux pump [Clostridia bacterium]|nr:manganese efflux pump [Clostridia bacterium]